MNGAKLEVAFYSQDEASVFFETSAPAEDRGAAALIMFVHYVVRQFANIGQTDEGYMLAQAISKVAYEPGLDSIREIIQGVRVIPSRGRGRKGFEATFDFDGGRFNLKPYGFGIMGKGIGYYSPVSVFVLLQHLWEGSDDALINGLLMAMMQLTTMGHIGAITAANQAGQADNVLVHAMPVYERIRNEQS